MFDGVIVTVVDEALSPIAVTVRNAIVYDVPVVRPEIVTGLAVSAGENAVKVPPFSDYL